MSVPETNKITDIDSSYPTTLSLMRCKRQVLRPYRQLLCLTTTTTHTPATVTTERHINHTIIMPWDTIGPGEAIDTAPHTKCGHIISTYILPDILHLISFILGYIYFRVTEGEQLYSLMEKVFIHADQNIRQFSPNRVIKRLRAFLIIGCFWVVAAMSSHALFMIVYGVNGLTIFEKKGLKQPAQWILFVIELLALFISNCIHLAVVMNFSTHCEMIIFYCKAIRTRLEEKSLHLVEAMKRIVLGLVILIFNRIDQPLVWTYRAIYPLVWICILGFCLAQAARVTEKCDKFYKIGLSMRVYGYHTSTSNELDSFMLFLSQAQLRAKLFALTVHPGKVIGIVVTCSLLIIVLIQTSVIASPNFFF
ncbi:unnamed protein product [Didymodactylos carnosus]|uniref:Uncharacterized protein n=1 Tax=Didymodactylos carnosus TaxID=1234261 RepID=A0A814YIN5_9BILA|nr:unnamed protein product [Didymodactylos carnosus]CAF3993890.1 unnamed protein product [Didymodactylos carnosus]